MKILPGIIETLTANQRRSFKDVATSAGITERTLKAARSGQEIQPATAGGIAAALGVSVEEISSGYEIHKRQSV